MEMDSQEQVARILQTTRSMAFVGGDKSPLKHLTRILRRVFGEVIVVDSLAELAQHEGLNLVTVSYDDLDVDARAHLLDDFSTNQDNSTLILLSEGSAQQDFARLFGSHILTNLLVINSANVDAVDLLVTIHKIVQRDIFGLEKYFSWGIKSFSTLLRCSTERQQAMTLLDQYSQSIGIPRRLSALIHSAADEFITNAIYNAPVDAEGQSRFSHLPRTQEVILDPGEEVEVRFCCDGRRFGIATIDPFGSLTPERLRGYLAKCFRKEGDQVDVDPGGAGLGFYHIFDALSHFVVNISPGKRTEMIGLVDISGSYKDFIKSGKSFNIFVSE